MHRAYLQGRCISSHSFSTAFILHTHSTHNIDIGEQMFLLDQLGVLEIQRPQLAGRWPCIIIITRAPWLGRRGGSLACDLVSTSLRRCTARCPRLMHTMLGNTYERRRSPDACILYTLTLGNTYARRRSPATWCPPLWALHCPLPVLYKLCL